MLDAVALTMARGGGCLQHSVTTRLIVLLLLLIRHELNGWGWRVPALLVARCRREARWNSGEVINIPTITIAAFWLLLEARWNGEKVINVPTVDVTALLLLNGDY